MSGGGKLTIALGCDHRGAAAIAAIDAHLRALGHETRLLGDCSGAAADYPDGAYLVAEAVVDGRADRGVLVCGSGVGVAMAANKVPGARAGLACDVKAAEMMRRHNDANVLCLSGDRLRPEECAPFVDAFLAAPFEGGRHARRVNKMIAMDRGEDPRRITAPAG